MKINPSERGFYLYVEYVHQYCIKSLVATQPPPHRHDRLFVRKRALLARDHPEPALGQKGRHHSQRQERP